MATLAHTTIINRPVEDVWAFAADPANDLQWISGLVESNKISEGPMGVGTQLRGVRRFMGRRIEFEMEITEWEPNKKTAIKSTSGPIQFEASRAYESVEGGTKISESFEAELGGFFKLAEPLVTRMAKRQMEADYGNLKDLLASQA